MKTTPNSEIPLRTLGRTGEKVSAIGLGGFHIGARVAEYESIRIMRYAIDNGITFMDNCWITMKAPAKSGWGKRLKTATGIKFS